MDISDRQARAQALARTYGGERDGWERLMEYQRALEWRSKHPNKGSSAAANALDMPRGRLRAWFDAGSKPDPVHAVDRAETNGWIDSHPGEHVFEALSVLHAWVYAGGSIDQTNYVPMFAVGEKDPRELAVEALQAVGLQASIDREDEPNRATEVRPAGPGGTHLGRFLHGVLGAPIGPKTERSMVELPTWLVESGASTRLRWARIYVTLHAVRIDAHRHGYPHQLDEARSRAFQRQLHELLASVAPAESVTLAERGVLLRPAAGQELNVVPTLPE